MEPSDINVQTLLMFYECYRSGSVSEAAKRLGTSQPNATIALNKLRQHFSDPLFVKVGRRMEPTAQADLFFKGIEPALLSLSAALLAKTDFDAATSTRLFSLAMSEMMQVALLPMLYEHLMRVAPSTRLTVVRASDTTVQDLASGKVDLAIGYLADTGSNFHDQTLAMRDFVCIARAGHPRIQGTISGEQFYEEHHASHVDTGVSITAPEQTLDKRRRRSISVTLPDLAGIDSLIERSDLIATVPRIVAQFFQTRSNVQILDHPIFVQQYAVKCHWHERFHRDPAVTWLRREMVDVFRKRIERD